MVLLWRLDASAEEAMRRGELSVYYGRCLRAIHEGRSAEALQTAELLDRLGFPVPSSVLLRLLNECIKTKDLNSGRRIQSLIASTGEASNPILVDSLIRLFALGESLSEAMHAFCRLSVKDKHVWTSIISAHAKRGQGQRAMELYQQMRKSDVVPDAHVYAAALKACACCSALEEGRLIHTDIVKSGLNSDIFLSNCLIDMYTKCGNLEAARRVFDEMMQRDIASWNAIISGYAHHGTFKEAFDLYKEMKIQGLKPDKHTFLPLLKACRSMDAINQGKFIHTQVRIHGLESDLYVATALVDMYAKLGCIEMAYQTFKEMRVRSVVLWNAMISAYVHAELFEEALNLFNLMEKEGFAPDRVTYLSVLKSCSSLVLAGQGKVIHAQLSKKNLDLDIFIGSALVNMYTKFGCLDEARRAFLKLPKRDIVSWNAIIAGCAECGHFDEALNLFERMQKEGIQADKVMYMTILKVCGSMAALDRGRIIHTQLRKLELDSDPCVRSALFEMYAKCGSINEAFEVFHQSFKEDVFCWNLLIRGCVDNGHATRAMELFNRMLSEGMIPDKVTFVLSLQACTQLGALTEGKLIHSQLKKAGLDLDLFVASTLIDMYGKCGCLDEARDVFFRVPRHTLVLWNSIINGYAQQGHGQVALELFKAMQEEGTKPNDVTLLCVLSSCSHAGLVKEGYALFCNMQTQFGIAPLLEHYTCVVDLLGRAGHLNKAHDLICSMPMEPNAAVWMSLLGACRTHDDVELGRVSFESLVKLEPNNASAYVLMNQIHMTAHSKCVKLKSVHTD